MHVLWTLALKYSQLAMLTSALLGPIGLRRAFLLVRGSHLSPGLIGVSRLRYDKRRSIGRRRHKGFQLGCNAPDKNGAYYLEYLVLIVVGNVDECLAKF